MNMPPKKTLRNPLQFTAAAALVTAAVLYPAAEASAIEKIHSYCAASWRNAGIQEQAWNDCTQEAITNLLERVSRNGLVAAIQKPNSEQRRELNRSIWRTSQRWRRAKRNASLDAMESFEVADQRLDLELHDSDESLRLQQAMSQLSPTQQTILKQWSEGSSIREIAEELDIPAARVSDQKYKAVQKLKQQLV